MYRIESFLSARLFVVPQLVGDRIFFMSNLSGHLSLYAMDYGGSVPEPLLPPGIALQNPHLMMGHSFYVFPELGKIMVLIDKDGNEDYKPMFIPMKGGYPTPAFGDRFDDYKVILGKCDPEKNIAYMFASSHKEASNTAYRADLNNADLTVLYDSVYGGFPDGHSDNHKKVIINEGYAVGDHVLYIWREGVGRADLLYGKPLSDRESDHDVEINGIHSCHFIRNNQSLIMRTTLFEDTGGLGYLDMENPNQLTPMGITGEVHTGLGEFNGLKHLKDNRYLASYNIDGCDWVYEGVLDEQNLTFYLQNVITGQGNLANGVIEHLDYEKSSDKFAISFSTAISPTQIYTGAVNARNNILQHTNERVLGVSEEWLSAGEDASFTSFDGTRVSARMYLPAEELDYSGSRPLVYYVHGGPQSQERPDFAWFSMPLIQFLTLNGFAVFVPNVRGSTGYGMKYTKEVDRDWGGKDRLDHVHAMTEFLPSYSNLDTSRAGVVGRSYGGYMTLMLAGRHPQLWKAAVDMFGPYDLVTFSERIPETWKPYFKITLGDPDIDTERQFLIDRSPRTYIEDINCPLMVIQGKNDPRVVEAESRDLVDHLRKMDKDIDYIVFEDEGHDVLKFNNRVKVYNTITNYFIKHLKP